MASSSSFPLAERAVRAALKAASPDAAVRSSIRWGPSGEVLTVAGVEVPASAIDEVVLLAAGKASGAMADAAIDALLLRRSSSAGSALPFRIRGLVVTKYGHQLPAGRTRTGGGRGEGAPSPPPPSSNGGGDVVVDVDGLEAAHPTPDAEGLAAAERFLALAGSAGPRSLLLVLLSGGGSALLPLPARGLSLADLQATNDALLACGAPIDDVNCVRKHMSRLSGGRLAAAGSSAFRVLTLALSDVIGDRADVIASGPTVPDPTTFADALDVVARHNIEASLPPGVLAHLRAGAAGEHEETPKTPLPSAFFSLVGGNASALEAAAEELSASFTPSILTTSFMGEAKEAGRAVASIVHGADAAASGAWGAPAGSRGAFRRLPAAILLGGETTVTLGPHPGKGGRNMELALSAAVTLKALMPPAGVGARGRPLRWAVVAFGTDGTDGPTDAAGAFVTHDTIDAGVRCGMDARDFLARHDSYTFFARLSEGTTARGRTAGKEEGAALLRGPGGLIITGPTGTNVGDVTLVLLADTDGGGV